MSRIVGATLAAVMLSGCATSLSTLPDRDTTASGDALLGVPYALPMLQYDMTLTRALSGCPDDRSGVLADRKVVMRAGKLSINRKAEAKERYGPGERYAVDYRALQAPFKTSSFSFVVNPNGTLKSINVSAEDQSAEVIKSVAGAVLTIASLASKAAPNLGNLTPSEASNPPPQPPPPLSAHMTAQMRAALQAALRQREIAALADLADQAVKTRIVGCTDAAAELVTDSSDNSDQQDTASAKLKTLTSDVTRLTLIANLKGGGTTEDAARGSRGSRADKTDWAEKLNSAIALQDEATRDLQKSTEAGAKIDGKLTAVEKSVWPISFYDRHEVFRPDDSQTKKLKALLIEGDVALITPAVFKPWFKKQSADLQAVFRKMPLFAGMFDKTGAVVDAPTDVDRACEGPTASLDACFAVQTGVYAQLLQEATGLKLCSDVREPDTKASEADMDCRTIDSAIRPLDEGEPRESGAPPVVKAGYLAGRHARDPNPDKGVFVREPASARLWVCPSAMAKPSDTKAACNPDKKVFSSDIVSAPQFGQLRYLPFRNGPFEGNELALSLRDDGSVEKFEYKVTKAAGVAAAAAAQDAIAQYKTYRDAQDKKKTDDLASARTAKIADIEYQIDVLTKQKALLDLQTPPPGDPDKAIKDEATHIATQTALLNAQLAQLQAQAALTAAGGGS